MRLIFCFLVLPLFSFSVSADEFDFSMLDRISHARELSSPFELQLDGAIYTAAQGSPKHRPRTSNQNPVAEVSVLTEEKDKNALPVVLAGLVFVAAMLTDNTSAQAGATAALGVSFVWYIF